MRRADGTIKWLARGHTVHELAWSPDGRLLAATHLEKDTPTVESVTLIRADGSIKMRHFLDDASSPTWSPDGRRLAFVRSMRLTVVAVARPNHPRTIATGDLQVARPAWSPTGKEIAFGGVGRAGIYAVRIDGTHLRQITAGIIGAAAPDWSPDGRRIVYTDGGRLAIIRRDGSLRIITQPTNAADGAPSWSPDGRRIVFARYPRDPQGVSPSDLYTIGADGRFLRRLTRTPTVYEHNPDWR